MVSVHVTTPVELENEHALKRFTERPVSEASAEADSAKEIWAESSTHRAMTADVIHRSAAAASTVIKVRHESAAGRSVASEAVVRQ